VALHSFPNSFARIDAGHFSYREESASRIAMSALDIFVIILLGGGAVIGFVRGLVHEMLSLLAWVVAIVMLRMFHTPVSEALVAPVGTPTGGAVLAFVILFLPSFLFMKLLARSLGRKSRRSMLGPFDRVLGGGFGMLKGLLAATLFFLVANLATDLIYGPDEPRPDWMRNSRTYPLLNASGRAVVDWVETRRKGPPERIEDDKV
jgi:membrane protein required for colicin V production